MFFEKKDKIIFIDIDDTLANTRQGVYNLYLELTDDATGNINIKTKEYLDFCPKWEKKDLDLIFKNGYTLYDKIKPLPGAVEGVKALIAKGYDVRIATIHTATGIPAKQLWIDKHFPSLSKKVYYINSTEVNKDIFKEYGIIDDDIKNIHTNESALPVLIDFYNIYSATNEIEHKCRNWNEVIDKF